MRISYKAVYHLLEDFYPRRSLNTFLEEIPQDIFRASLLFAKQNEDYEYLDVMITQRERLDNEYAMFIAPHSSPIILRKNVDLTLLEFAFLCRNNTNIHISRFQEVVEAIALNKSLDSDKICKEFENLVKVLTQESEDAE